LALALSVASSASVGLSPDQLAVAVENTRHIWAPEIQSIGGPELRDAFNANSTYRPAVIAHGMGDAGTNAGMKSLCKTVSDKYPGAFVLCSTTANGAKSISTPYEKQLEEFQAEIAQYPELKNGFNAVGLSQGNFLVEAYIALVNDPPVHNFASICGPLEGIGTCPKNLAFDAICPIWKLDPYGANLAFSSYWKGTKDKAKYLAKSRLLADVLNEKEEKNATVKANWLKLNSITQIEGTKDTMLVPRETEQFGMWDWGTSGKNAPVVSMRDSEGYQGDWVGLKTLDQQGKLKNMTFDGEHLQFSNEFWHDNVLPLLGNFLP